MNLSASVMDAITEKRNIMRMGLTAYAKTLDQTPPEGCPFKLGDTVTFTNDYGCVFPGLRVIGYSSDLSQYGRCIHLNTDAYWFPHKASELTLEN